MTPKTHGQLLLVKIMGFLKSANTLGLHCIKIPEFTPVEILGYFLRTRFLTPKTHCLYGLSKSWDFFFLKENRDFGHTLYENFRLNTHQNLGCLIRTMFLDAKNPWPILLVKVLGFLKRTEILGLHCIKMSSKTPVKILGYFIRTMFLTPKKKHILLLLVKILGLLKSTEILGLHRNEILELARVRILVCQNLASKNHVFDAKNQWPNFACQNLGLFEECKDIWPTLN